MTTMNVHMRHLKRAITPFLAFFVSLLVIFGCASHKPQISTAQYRFNYKGEDYRLRSVYIEIRSFQPGNAPHFNQFIISENRRVICPEISITIDHDADGTLNEVLKGSLSLEAAQARYTAVIEAGLQSGELIRSGSQIIVRPKIR